MTDTLSILISNSINSQTNSWLGWSGWSLSYFKWMLKRLEYFWIKFKKDSTCAQSSVKISFFIILLILNVVDYIGCGAAEAIHCMSGQFCDISRTHYYEYEFKQQAVELQLQIRVKITLSKANAFASSPVS